MWLKKLAADLLERPDEGKIRQVGMLTAIGDLEDENESLRAFFVKIFRHSSLLLKQVCIHNTPFTTYFSTFPHHIPTKLGHQNWPEATSKTFQPWSTQTNHSLLRDDVAEEPCHRPSHKRRGWEDIPSRYAWCEQVGPSSL